MTIEELEKLIEDLKKKSDLTEKKIDDAVEAFNVSKRNKDDDLADVLSKKVDKLSAESKGYIERIKVLEDALKKGATINEKGEIVYETPKEPKNKKTESTDDGDDGDPKEKSRGILDILDD